MGAAKYDTMGRERMTSIVGGWAQFEMESQLGNNSIGIALRFFGMVKSY